MSKTEYGSLVDVEYFTDSEGFRIKKERLLDTVPISVERKSTTEKWMNSAMLSEASAVVRLRYPTFCISTKTALLIGEKRYNILSVENVRSRNRWLELVVREEVCSDADIQI